MSITDFLLARIAEDEQRAKAFEHDTALSMNGTYGNWELHHGWPEKWRAVERMGFLPSRVLAECAAKREIIDAHRRQDEDDDPSAWIVASEVLLRSLAAVYRDHPGYQQEWGQE